MVPEQKVQYIPYTTCKMVPEEHSEVIKCRRCRYVTEEHCQKVPYVTCRLETQEYVKQVPCTTCSLEAYCVTVKVCRKVPVCEPICEAACPRCPSICCTKPRWQEWLSRFGRRPSESDACNEY
jgi:hypothetical protein